MASSGYLTTPDEAQPLADDIVTALTGQGWKCKRETPFDPDAPLTTAVLATKRQQPAWLIEPQARPSYGPHLVSLSAWLRAQRSYASLYIATTSDGSVSGTMLKGLQKDGVGLIIIDPGLLTISLAGVVPALVVHLDPSLTLGSHGPKVRTLVENFNAGNRVAALRDMCEFVEGETGKLIRKARLKGKVTKTAAEIDGYDWSTQIDVLKSAGVIDATIKADLHSFRCARNLVDHPPRSSSQSLSRKRQLGERMVMGARLSGELFRESRKL